MAGSPRHIDLRGRVEVTLVYGLSDWEGVGGTFRAATCNYNLTFILQLRKMAEKLIRGSQKLLGTVPYVDWATVFLLRLALTGMLISCCFRLRPEGDFGQPLIGTSAIQIAGLGVPRT